MARCTPTERHLLRSLRVGLVALGCSLCLASGAWATPDKAAEDGLLQVLNERGLLAAELPARAAGLVAGIGGHAADVVFAAMNHLGVRYRRGGSSADTGFDCSGFTRHVFQSAIGLVLPRRADLQARDESGLAIERSELRPGDLVFFNTMRRAFSHVGIYVGEGKFIHAPRTGGRVRIESMHEPYWTKRFDGARRLGVDVRQGEAPEPLSTTPNPRLP